MEDEVRFGPFVLRASRRTLTMDGKAIALGSRAIDILTLLTSNPGKLLTNAEIVRHAWPDTFVDETNLRVHISALRRALGDTKHESQYISNVPGRGYTFVAEVTRNEPGYADPGRSSASSSSAEPRAFGRLFGRDDTVATLVGHLSKSRLLTIVGSGGIGKSSVARALLSQIPDEVLWVDLAELNGGELISTEVSSKLNILPRTGDVTAELAEALDGRNIVIVLDSCEHMVEEAALFAEAILSRTATLRVLATSREPLRADGEWVHRLSPLYFPAAASTAVEALCAPAVQLFVERAAACRGGYDLTDEEIPHVLEVCQQLDGIALAIELAAARMDTMSAKALSASLQDSFRVLSRGRRTAMPRHQTLRATLDWSYFVLDPSEQEALQRLSVFRGWFTSRAADAVLGEAEELIDLLVSKSLVVVEARAEVTRYRLLDTTRLYAYEKLVENGMKDEVLSSLANFLIDLFEAAEQELYSANSKSWSHDFAQHVSSLRSALGWALGPEGDFLTGVRLTVAALPLFFRLSLLDECFVSVTKALTYLEDHPDLDERSRMKLYAALGWPQMRSTDICENGVEAWTRALEIAERIGDLDYQLRALWAMWVDAINSAQPSRGIVFAEEFAARAQRSPDPVDTVVAKRIMGATLHWLGRHRESRDLLEQMLQEYDALPSGQTARFQFDQRITAMIILARCLWVLGDDERALALVRESVDHAIAIGHQLSLTNVLAEAACPIALLEGRLDLAAEYIDMLAEHTSALSLDVWNTYARCFQAELALREGRPHDCLELLRPNMAVLNECGFNLFRTWFQTVEAQALQSLGRTAEAHRVIEEAISSAAQSGERWCVPELLRVKGMLESEGEGGDGAASEGLFAQACREAEADGAIAWLQRIGPEMPQRPVILGQFRQPSSESFTDTDRRSLH